MYNNYIIVIFRFSADKNIFEAIETHCVLNVKEKTEYKLVKKDDLPSNYEPDRIEEITSADVENAIALSQESK